MCWCCLCLPVALNPRWSGASSLHPLPEPPSCPLAVLMTSCLDQLSAAILKRKAALRAFILITQCGLWWSNFLQYLFLFFGWIIFNACCFVHSISAFFLTRSSNPVSVSSSFTMCLNNINLTHMPLGGGFCRAFLLCSKAWLQIQLVLLFVENTSCYPQQQKFNQILHPNHNGLFIGHRERVIFWDFR